MLSNYQSASNDIEKEIHVLLGDLKSLRPIAGSQLRKTTDTAINQVSVFITTPSEDLAWKSYNMTYQLLTEVQHLQEELWLQ
jgi:hypothetical protein